MLGHRANLIKFKKIEIMLSTFSKHSAMRLENQLQGKTVVNTNMWRLNNMLLKNITKDIKAEINT